MTGTLQNPCQLWLIRLLIIVLAIVAFEPALRNSFTHDDIAQVTDINAPETPGDWMASLAVPWWPNRLKRLWRPVTRLSILAQKAIHPERPAFFYGFNLLLNASVALALFGLARQLGMGLWPSAIGAILFAAHPLHAEVIHQVVGRAELWAALWMLLGLWFFVVRGGLRDCWIWLHQPLFYALALGSKEHAVLYPLTLVLVLAAMCKHRGDFALQRDFKRVALLLVQLGLVLALFLGGKAVVTGGILEPSASIPFYENPLLGLGLIQRLPAVLGIFAYAGVHFFWPMGLCPDYSAHSLPLDAGWRWGWSWLGLALAVGIGAFIVRDLRRGGRGWLLAVAGLAAYGLTSNGPVLIGTVMAERLWYWPSATACLGAGWGLTQLGEWVGGRWMTGRSREERWRTAVLGLALLAVGLLSAAWAYAPAWRSERAYAQWTVDRFPHSWRGHVNLAREDYKSGQFAEGLAHALAATAIEPEQAIGWDWLGLNATFLPGRGGQAGEAFEQALELDPDLHEVWRHWANLLQSEGRNAEAADRLERYLATGAATDPPAIEVRLRTLRGE